MALPPVATTVRSGRITALTWTLGRSIDGAATYAGLGALVSMTWASRMLGLPPPMIMTFCDCTGGNSTEAPWSRAPKLNVGGIAAAGSGV